METGISLLKVARLFRYATPQVPLSVSAGLNGVFCVLIYAVQNAQSSWRKTDVHHKSEYTPFGEKYLLGSIYLVVIKSLTLARIFTHVFFNLFGQKQHLTLSLGDG